MKVAAVFMGLLVALGVSYAAEGEESRSPLLVALQPAEADEVPAELVVAEPQVRQKRGLLLGAAALGAGALGAGVVGAGLLGAGAVGAGILGAKAVGAGVVGGALAAKALYPYGYYGGGRGYGYYGGNNGYYGGNYRAYHYGHVPTVYIVEEYW